MQLKTVKLTKVRERRRRDIQMDHQVGQLLKSVLKILLDIAGKYILDYAVVLLINSQTPFRLSLIFFEDLLFKETSVAEQLILIISFNSFFPSFSLSESLHIM